MVIGGGFIGSEIAAALAINNVKVMMIFPDLYLVGRVFPESLGMSLQRHYRERGITILNGEKPASFTKKNGRFVIRTESGKEIESDMLIVGVGISLSLDLARNCGAADRQRDHRG